MFDVSLYGNITFDRIIHKDRRDNSIGSIGNVWKNLNFINVQLIPLKWKVTYQES